MLRRTLKHQKLMKMLSQSIKRPFRLPKAHIQRTFRKVDYSRYKDKFTRSHDYVRDPFAPHESTCSTKSRNMKRRAEARQFLNRSVEIPKFNRNNENPTYIWIEEMGIEPSPRGSRIKTLIYQAKKRNAKRQHRKSFKANDYDRIMKQVYEWKQLKKRVIQEALFQNVVKEWDFYRTFQNLPRDKLTQRLNNPQDHLQMSQAIPKVTCARMVAQVVQDMVLAKEIPLKRQRKMSSQTRFWNPFEKEEELKISIIEYIDRLGDYLHVSGSCFILALIYIDRITQKAQVRLSQLSIHRLFTTSILLAMKYHDDIKIEDPAYIATVVGIPQTELKILEVAFMSMINFELYVRPSKFRQYCEFLVLSQTPEMHWNEEKEFRIQMKKKMISMGLCSCGRAEHSTRSPSLHNRRKKKRQNTRKRKLLKKGKSQNFDTSEAKPCLVTLNSDEPSSEESNEKLHLLKEYHEESTQDSREGSFIDNCPQNRT